MFCHHCNWIIITGWKHDFAKCKGWSVWNKQIPSVWQEHFYVFFQVTLDSSVHPSSLCQPISIHSNSSLEPWSSFISGLPPCIHYLSVRKKSGKKPVGWIQPPFLLVKKSQVSSRITEKDYAENHGACRSKMPCGMMVVVWKVIE